MIEWAMFWVFAIVLIICMCLGDAMGGWINARAKLIRARAKKIRAEACPAAEPLPPEVKEEVRNANHYNPV